MAIPILHRTQIQLFLRRLNLQRLVLTLVSGHLVSEDVCYERSTGVTRTRSLRRLRVRYEWPFKVITSVWWTSRSIITAATISPEKISPHRPKGMFETTNIAPCS
jgi:hypothetical protein